MENIILSAILIAIVAAVLFYIYKSKKKGHACIGCPYADECKGKCGSYNNYS